VTTSIIIKERLLNQQIGNPGMEKPEEVVSWMGAIQAQEYAMAKWAIGLRLKEVHDSDVELAFNEGRILRTHLLRPTWHFVSPADIRWITQLTAPGIHALSAYMIRQLELDERTLKKSNKIIAKSLEGGQHLIRTELQKILKRNKVEADGLRMGYMMMRAELDGIACSGPRIGKQFSYALLDERAPLPSRSKKYDREDAVTKLARIYFSSRGPATLYDFSNWSGLSITDSKAATENIRADFNHERNGKTELFFGDSLRKAGTKILSTFLMPDYDEYGMAYKDRSALIDPKIKMHFQRDGSTAYNRWIVVEGKIAGTWKKVEKRKCLDADLTIFGKLPASKSKLVINANERYKTFFSK
jgi:hypothetical protein